MKINIIIKKLKQALFTQNWSDNYQSTNLQPTTYNLQPSYGFTMVELLVALTIFAVVVSIASGVFINSLRTQRAVAALMAANDNASLVLEQMSREIRTGFQFTANASRDELRFTNQLGEDVIYRFNRSGGAVERNGQRLTGGNVKVDYLSFNLLGEAAGDGQSTRVTVRLGVSAADARVGDIITSLQTTVSSRQLDI